MLIIIEGLSLFFSLYQTTLSKLENLKLAEPDISSSSFEYSVEEKKLFSWKFRHWFVKEGDE